MHWHECIMHWHILSTHVYLYVCVWKECIRHTFFLYTPPQEYASLETPAAPTNSNQHENPQPLPAQHATAHTPQYTTAPGLERGLFGGVEVSPLVPPRPDADSATTTAATSADHLNVTQMPPNTPATLSPARQSIAQRAPARVEAVQQQQGGAGAPEASPLDPTTGKVSLEQLFAGVLLPEAPPQEALSQESLPQETSAQQVSTGGNASTAGSASEDTPYTSGGAGQEGVQVDEAAAQESAEFAGLAADTLTSAGGDAQGNSGMWLGMVLVVMVVAKYGHTLCPHT